MFRDRPSRFALWLLKPWQSTILIRIESDIVYFKSKRESFILAPLFYIQENGRIVGVGEYSGSAEGVRTLRFLHDLNRSSDSYGALVKFLQFGIQRCMGQSMFVKPRVIIELAIDIPDESLFSDAVYEARAGKAEVTRRAGGA